LQEWALPPGSEIVISAVTIPHILDILAHHQLVAVPVDIDLTTLAVDAEAVRAAITPRTRAIMVAHLFGSRMPMDAIAAVAAEHSFPLVEDCAQLVDGSEYRGHAGSAVSLFSFGSIKRQTALGGALLRFREAGLAARVRMRQSRYPVQRRFVYARRVLTMVMIKSLSLRPVFQLYLRVCRWRGWDHDETLGTALRGFAGGDLIARLRHQPSAPLLRLLDRRLGQSPRAAIARRVAIVETVVAEVPDLCHPGAAARHHTHWLFPVLTRDPDRLMRRLWARGFDATRGASNLTFVPAPGNRPVPSQAARLMREVLYLPLYPSAGPDEMRAMGRAIRELDGP
jgi:dTDP-4-amino-4,6-dideoxygalactose transaminase